MRPLVPPSVKECFGVLEGIALHLVSQKPVFLERFAVYGFHQSNRPFAHDGDRDASYGPDEGEPVVEPGNEGLGLNPNLTVSGQYPTLRHLFPCELPDEDTYLVVCDAEDSSYHKVVEQNQECDEEQYVDGRGPNDS